MAAPAAIDDVLPALRALAEPHRLAVLLSLRERERCVRDLVDEVGAPQPLVSHHLAKLAEAGLVTSRQADGFTYYALAAAGLDGARVALEGLLSSSDLPAAAQPGGGVGCCR